MLRRGNFLSKSWHATFKKEYFYLLVSAKIYLDITNLFSVKFPNRKIFQAPFSKKTLSGP